MQQPRTLKSSPKFSPTYAHHAEQVRMSEHAVLMIDTAGLIRYASLDSHPLFNIASSTLMGEHITHLIPDWPPALPAPLSNLSYLNAQPGENIWQPLSVNHRLLNARISQRDMAGTALTIMELRRSAAQQEQWHLQRLIRTFGDWEDMLVITDTIGNIVYVNPGFESLTGFCAEDVMGKTQEQILGGEMNQTQYGQMWSRLKAGKSFHAVFYSRRKTAQRFYEERHARPFVNDDGQVSYYVFSSRDVSERERQMQHLAHLANHDELTGLPNRHLFMDRLQQAQAHATRSNGGFCLLLLDLDDFKAINDQYGHAAGDAVLVAVANRLRACVREADTIARLGGDEFAIILTDTMAEEDVRQVLNKIMIELRKAIRVNELELPSLASIGVAYYPSDSPDTDSLLNQADIAMYQVKAVGGNGYDVHRPHNFSLGQIDMRKFILDESPCNQTIEKENTE